MNPIPLNVPLEVLGDWYLPSAPEERIAGLLRYVPAEGCTIELSESFEFWFDGFHQDLPKRYEIVHGVTRNHKLVTLFDAVASKLSIDPNKGHRADDLFSTQVLIGAHVEAGHRYCRFRCRVPGLQIWLSQRIVEREHSRDSETQALELTYRIRQPKEEAFYVAQLSGDIGWETLWQVADDDNATRVSVSSAGWISLRPDEPQSFAWFLARATCVTELIAFIAGSPMAPDVIETYDEGSITANFHLVALNGAKCCNWTERLDFFLLRANLGIGLETAAKTWFSIYSKIEVAAKLALSTLTDTTRWPHLDFLLLMQH